MISLVPESAGVLHASVPIYDFASQSISERQHQFETMKAIMLANNGIGLAAPQVGLALNFFIMMAGDATIICYNPQIVSASNQIDIATEGCLSFKGLMLPVKRPQSISVRYQNIYGDTIEDTFDGMEARCFQHELDHLNGVTFTKRVGQVTLALAQKRRTKKGKHVK